MTQNRNTLRVGQFSAFYGDRPSTFRELLDSDVDVLTGDYLAELTMLVLTKNASRGGRGYADGFITQIAPFLAEIAERGVKVVTNAGGLDPLACAERLREEATRSGAQLRIAAITGDSVVERFAAMRDAGAAFAHLDDGAPLDVSSERVLAANAYLGAWPIVEALNGGADIVICPRVTDASLVMGPAAWRFGWDVDSYDELAGALWAGHAIECGAQVTGGNFSFFFEHDDLGVPGMPIAEISSNGDSVISRADGTGGVVTVDTVTAQLLYEVGSREYHNPDVVADLATIGLAEVGDGKVAIRGAVGYPPTASTKLSLCYEGGFKNTMIVGITGAHLDEKVAWLRREVEKAVGAAESFDSFRWSVIGPADPTGGTFDDATALVYITARHSDRDRVGRARFSDRIVQLGVSNIPGYYMPTPPLREKSVGIQWPCLIEKAELRPQVWGLSPEPIDVPWPSAGPTRVEPVPVLADPADPMSGPLESVRLGERFGTRSGDKAGLANLGVWARSRDDFAWLESALTTEELVRLLPELDGYAIDRHVFPRISGVNFVIKGYLEQGVSSSTRIDAQAKGLGEFLGSRTIQAPIAR